jgi:hypothetical protein
MYLNKWLRGTIEYLCKLVYVENKWENAENKWENIFENDNLC